MPTKTQMLARLRAALVLAMQAQDYCRRGYAEGDPNKLVDVQLILDRIQATLVNTRRDVYHLDIPDAPVYDSGIAGEDEIERARRLA